MYNNIYNYLATESVLAESTVTLSTESAVWAGTSVCSIFKESSVGAEGSGWEAFSLQENVVNEIATKAINAIFFITLIFYVLKDYIN